MGLHRHLASSFAAPASGGVLAALRRAIRAIEGMAGEVEAGAIPFGIAPIDEILGGGLARGSLHEIAAAGESGMAAATGFALALARHQLPLLWVAEDMARAESGAPYGPGLVDLGLPPEGLITMAAARGRDVLWAMEEGLNCRAVGAVIGEIRSPVMDLVASRRLSLAAGRRNGLALLLRTAPRDASAAATRWVIRSAPSAADRIRGPGPPRLAVELTRNRRGRLGTWMVEWSRDEQQFTLAAHSQSVADAAADRPHRAAARA
jgi:protein ImuA